MEKGSLFMWNSTILIVDDEPTGRETLEALLIAHGYTLAFAANGAEALEKAAELTPDLVLLDVMMPGMDGFETCRRMRTSPLLADVPIIMVTALDDQESRVQGIEAGADDFVSKPFNRTELRARVKTVTRLNRYRRLLAERARFEWVVEQAEYGYLTIDDDDRITYANERAREYLYLPSSWSNSAVNERFLTIAQRHYRCEPAASWEGWPEPPNTPQFPTLATLSAGDIYPLRYLVQAETSLSHATWLQVDTFDVPESVLAKERLVRLRDVTEQMTRQRQMWTFHSIISHKLGTPLSSLLSSLHLLGHDVGKMSAEEVEEFATIALRSAERLRRQLYDIRQYLRTTDTATPGEECHIAQIEPMIQQMSQEMEIPSVQVMGLENVGDVPLVLSQQAIDLILRQLLDNTKKFHPQHSPVVEIIFSRSHDNAVGIRVCDDGVHLSAEQLATAWVPYYQAEKDFSGEVPGMGLGLAMVAALLWNVGGQYHLSNRSPGPGVEVELIIPLAAMV
jgi:DNA-binding response OmpR family regulator